jgi:hypothetical protein
MQDYLYFLRLIEILHYLCHQNSKNEIMQLSIKSLLGSVLLAAMPLVFTSCEGTLDDLFGEWSRPTPQTPTATIKFTAMNEFQDADNKVPKDVTIAKLTLKSSCLPNGQLVLDDQITSPASSVTVSIPNPPSGEQSYDIVATDTEGNEWTAEGISLTLNQGNNPDKTVALFNANHYPLTLEATENATTITVKNENGISGIYYAIGGGAKTELTGTSQNVSLQAGQRIQFFSTKSALGDANNANKCLNIRADKKCYAYGNVMSLIDDEANGFHKDVTIAGNSAFAYLFYYNANLYNHEMRTIVLPATALKYCCYSDMFKECTSLTSAPKLAATTLAEACYQYMFLRCTSLTSAPELPAEALKDYCYQHMFDGCKSLTSAPKLAATTLAKNCYYYMFDGCKSLTTAPELPAETLMDYCYAGMFNGCTKLASVTCKATNINANSCLIYWLNGAGTEATSPTVWVRSDMTSKGTADSDGQWRTYGTSFNIAAIP